MKNNSDGVQTLADIDLLAAHPKALFKSEQVYAIEQAWFNAGYDSFALMQQAAWQMTQYLITHAQQSQSIAARPTFGSHPLSAVVWTGAGNNGGDGWLIAHYLQGAGWDVTVVDVGEIDIEAQSDAARAKRAATQKAETSRSSINVIRFAQDDHKLATLRAHYHIDALFGIGLDRTPSGQYAEAITRFNSIVHSDEAIAAAVDIPSGVVASTGQVFSNTAVKANLTLCLVAPKLGLYIKDGLDYSGQIVDIPLIPYLDAPEPSAWRLDSALQLAPRSQNSHKGSYGHVMIIGGNQSASSQGMGGAAIMSSASALACGVGKVTTACHEAFHGALLATQPNAMVVNLQDKVSVETLIEVADVVAIGMGLGRDDNALSLFKHYLSAAIAKNKPMVIDADGLYHLATLKQSGDSLVQKLQAHTKAHQVCFTPHSGEAARLLDTDSEGIEADRLAAIHQCADIFGGDWLLKGAGSLVLAQGVCYVCAIGNPGMATAGMGDILSGLIAGLMVQEDLPARLRSLNQAVLIHGMAGDIKTDSHLGGLASNAPLNPLLRERSAFYPHPAIGERALQAQDMIGAIGYVMTLLTPH